MSEVQIKLYYKNVTSQVIGTEDGITPEDLRLLGGQDHAGNKTVEQRKKSRQDPV